MTIFKKISHFNELIGNAVGQAKPEQLLAQLEMINEEFLELREAIGNLVYEGAFDVEIARVAVREARDGIADVLVTTYGLAHRMGIDADADLAAVHVSNMSKFVRGSEQDAGAAAESVHKRLRIPVTIAETAPGLWAITSKRDSTGADGKFYPAGKLLKPDTYREPEFAN